MACRCSFPSLAQDLGLDELLERLDGLLFTGSPSNVEPHHYEGPPSDPGTLHDPARDATTLPLIRKAVSASACRCFGICRGFQEMNVAFGGTLHQKLHEVPGFLDHRDDNSQPLDVQYGPAHEVTLEPGGLLRCARRRRAHPGELAARPGRRPAGRASSPSKRARRTGSSRPSA